MSRQQAVAARPGLEWHEANRAFLDAHLDRLRRMLAERIAQLRQRWKGDPLRAYGGAVVSDERADAILAHPTAGRSAGRAGGSRVRSLRDDEAEAALRARATQRIGREAPLAELVRRFSLSPFERDVLLLALAPELDPDFEALYAYAQDDPQRRHPTPHLALALLAEGRDAEARAALGPAGTLRSRRLVFLDEPRRPGTAPGASALRVDERVCAHVLGGGTPDVRALQVFAPAAALPTAPAHREVAERAVRALLDAAGPWPTVNLVGAPGSGRRAVAAAIAAGLGLALVVLQPRRLPADARERREWLQVLDREAVLLGAAYYVELDASDGAEPGDAPLELVERTAAPLIAASARRASLGGPTLAIPVARPDAAGQEAMWREALGEPAAARVPLGPLTQQFDFGPAAIAAAGMEAWRRARSRGAEAPSPEDLWASCRTQVDADLHHLATRIESAAGWDDIVVPEASRRQLLDLAAQVTLRSRVYSEWGFGGRMGRGRGVTALFAGPSGTGKTMAAEILARELGVDLYRVDLAGVVSKYIGETEKNLRRIFESAERAGAALLFDESDALFGKRTEVRDSHDRFANIEIDYLLQRMEEYRGLAVLATNRRGDIDRAFLRRLRFLVDFPLPDRESRRQIWQKVFPPQAPLEALDHDLLSRMELSGGSIRNIAVNAAFLAAGDGTPIAMAHVMRAARREYAKADKMVTQAEFGPYHASAGGA